jgi:hypothetical protein
MARFFLACAALVYLTVSCGGVRFQADGRNDKKPAQGDGKASSQTSIQSSDKDPNTIDNDSQSVQSSGIQLESEEGELAIPPEMIAGAYLTCSPDYDVDGNETSWDAAGDKTHFGCQAVDKDKKALSLASVSAVWSLYDSSGAVLDAQGLSTTPDKPLHKLWEVDTAVYKRGINANLVLFTVDGSEHVVRPLDIIRRVFE